MRKTLLLLFAAMLTLGTEAQQNANPGTMQPTRTLNIGSGGACMYVYFPKSAKDSMRAVVACPGGGYDHLATANEGTNWARFFTERGIVYFTLTYRMPNGDRTIPISDAESAIRMVRDSAAAWHINPHEVGIMGSSAGGHLASTIATHADSTSRPDFQILFYPVITMTNATHKGSVVHLLGSDKDNDSIRREYSNELHVSKGTTPPAVILLASDDKGVPPLTNGVAYYSSLVRAGIPAALFCYPKGGHGFGYKTTFPYHDQMLQDLSSWLSEGKK